MTQIFHLPEEIKQELRLDLQGKIIASIRGVARLADIDKESIAKALRAGGDPEPSQLAVFLMNNGFNGGDLKAWIDNGIPDLAIALILEYYGYECQERYRREQAKKLCRAFRAVGFRVWAQQQLGWQNHNSESRLAEDLMLADYAARCAQNAGVDKNVTEQIKLEGLMKMYPDSQHLLKPQKEAIAASNPLPEKPMTATEVGRELAARLGYPKISARKVNNKLLQLGYQVSVTRVKRSTGKEVHDYYKPTEKGEPHSTLLLSLYLDGDGKATKAQLKWFSSIISILANNWKAEHSYH